MIENLVGEYAAAELNVIVLHFPILRQYPEKGQKLSFETFIISEFVCLIRSAHSRPEPGRSHLYNI